MTIDWTQLRPAKVNIQAYQGVTFRRKYLVRFKDGTPFPFAEAPGGTITWKAEAEVRPEAESDELLARMDTVSGGMSLALEAAGVGEAHATSWFQLELADTIMDALPAGRHVYDVTLLPPDGDSVPIQGGAFEIVGRATKRVINNVP